jgi:hypothetical protein
VFCEGACFGSQEERCFRGMVESGCCVKYLGILCEGSQGVMHSRDVGNDG